MSDRYSVISRVGGWGIDSFVTLEEAKEKLADCEEEDKESGDYEENFYQIKDNYTGEIVD